MVDLQKRILLILAVLFLSLLGLNVAFAAELNCNPPTSGSWVIDNTSVVCENRTIDLEGTNNITINSNASVTFTNCAINDKLTVIGNLTLSASTTSDVYFQGNSRSAIGNSTLQKAGFLNNAFVNFTSPSRINGQMAVRDSPVISGFFDFSICSDVTQLFSRWVGDLSTAKFNKYYHLTLSYKGTGLAAATINISAATNFSVITNGSGVAVFNITYDKTAFLNHHSAALSWNGVDLASVDAFSDTIQARDIVPYNITLVDYNGSVLNGVNANVMWSIVVCNRSGIPNEMFVQSAGNDNFKVSNFTTYGDISNGVLTNANRSKSNSIIVDMFTNSSTADNLPYTDVDLWDVNQSLEGYNLTLPTFKAKMERNFSTFSDGYYDAINASTLNLTGGKLLLNWTLKNLDSIYLYFDFFAYLDYMTDSVVTPADVNLSSSGAQIVQASYDFSGKRTGEFFVDIGAGNGKVYGESGAPNIGTSYSSVSFFVRNDSKVYFSGDLDGDGTPDNVDLDVDGDGINDTNDSIIGDAGDVQTNVANFAVTVNGSADLSQSYNDTDEVDFKSGSDTIVSFYCYSYLDISTASLQTGRGLVVLDGVHPSPHNVTVYLTKISNGDETVCAYSSTDAEGGYSASCMGGVEVVCNSTVQEGINCTDLETKFEIKGDGYSGFRQLMPFGCTDIDGDGYSPESECLWVSSTTGAVDCNDANANIHPGATDICGNGIDEDCSGSDASCGGGGGSGSGGSGNGGSGGNLGGGGKLPAAAPAAPAEQPQQTEQPVAQPQQAPAQPAKAGFSPLILAVLMIAVIVTVGGVVAFKMMQVPAQVSSQMPRMTREQIKQQVLVPYFQKAQASGLNPTQTYYALLKYGWPEDLIRETINEMYGSAQPSA